MRKRNLWAGLCAFALAGAMQVTTTEALPGADSASAASAKPATSPVAKKKGGKWYHVRPGATFNSAHGSNSVKYAINNKVKGAIDHSKRGSTIRIMSWNVMSSSAVDHLLAAQRRGVRVLVLMDATNHSEDVPNPDWDRLRKGLRHGNKGRKRIRHSGAKVCHSSCRGTTGLAHSKFFVFSKSGASRYVTMEGSANMTLAAATNQWNDIYTWVNSRPIYNFSVMIFNQMWRDKPVGAQWRQVTTGPYTLAFSPERGRYFHNDPVTQILSQVKCAGAVNGNQSHHTVIRLFPDVMRGSRGLTNARQIRGLWNAGCDVEVGYTVLSYKAHAVLVAAGGRGPVPMHHMTEDFNGDGDFDNYFHLKVLTVNGVLGNNRAAYKMVNGSSNLSGLSTVSDENIGVFIKPKVVQRYQKHLTYWFHHAPDPAYSSTTQDPEARMIAARRDPTLLLRTPTGAWAAQPDGYIAPGTMVVSPITGKVIDPYQNVDMD